eukprot:364935-Chlamydomonas_euryale.AAC.7
MRLPAAMPTWCLAASGPSGGVWLLLDPAVVSGCFWTQRWCLAASGPSGDVWLLLDPAVVAGEVD